MKGKSPAFFILAFSAVLAGFIIVSWFKGVGFKMFLAIAATSGEHSGALADGFPSAVSYRLLSVTDLTIESGRGSPPPVQALISGSLPDICAQVNFVEQTHTASAFVFKLASIPSAAPACLQQPLAFKMSLPLNVAGLPAGSYTVEANRARAVFDLPAGDAVSWLPSEVPIARGDIQVSEVKIESDFRSPIPNKVTVLASLPAVCAWLGETRLRREGNTFFLELVAHQPAQTDCPQEKVPFRLELSLNFLNLSAGSYTLNVNGVSASFDPSLRPLSP